MRSLIVIVAVCLLFGACGLMGPAANGTVTGTVYAVKAYGDPPEAGKPAAGRTVTLLDSDDGKTIASVMSDANGKFMFIAPPGNYSLWGGDRADPVTIESGKTVNVKIAVLDRQ
jgi:hypothetical protein